MEEPKGNDYVRKKTAKGVAGEVIPFSFCRRQGLFGRIPVTLFGNVPELELSGAGSEEAGILSTAPTKTVVGDPGALTERLLQVCRRLQLS